MFNGILDLIFIVEEYITFRIPQAGFFEHFYVNIFSKYLISGMCYTYSVVQGVFLSLSGITITLNRYIAVKYFTKYDYLWSGWRLILLSIWPLIISVSIFTIFHKTEVEYALTHLGVKLKVKLAKFAIVYCTFLTLLVCFEICITITVNRKAIVVDENLLTSYVFIETLMVFFTPYTLLYLNYDLRQKFFRFLRNLK
uniref:Serpentine receptor class gamma n=1 Tax=Strongyloides stercoralis TaxID=6248 RepID=A0AAF5D1B4_STRER